MWKKQIVFFWASSFLLAIAGYYLLWLIMPKHYVFGAWYRMLCYHWEHPVAYISIPCFCYGLIATSFSKHFQQQNTWKQIMSTLFIVILTLLVSCPLGGMLWQLHNMQAGYFPEGWLDILISQGFSWGLSIGWLIILLSVPYNILGLIICFFLTRKGVALFSSAYKPGSKATAVT